MTSILEQPAPRISETVDESFSLRRFTLDEYHQLINLGIFDDERVELLDGWIVSKMTKNPPHEAAVAKIMETLRPLLPAASGLRVQSAITIGADEPEPDLAVVRGPGSSYVHSHPGIGEIDLVIEVADSSLRKDRRKTQTYSRAEVPVYWIINLVEDCVEAFQQPLPSEGRYAVQRIHRRGETLAVSLQNSIVNVPVSSLLLDSPLPAQE